MNHIPNLLTLLRIGLVPVLILLLQQQAWTIALAVFLIAGVTDGLDGYIAKQFGYTTRLGAILDPIADKLLLISAFLMLTIAGEFPFWLLIIVAFRDLVIISGVVVLIILYGEAEMQPIWTSKINTCLQILLVLVVLVQKSGLLQLQGAIQVLIWLVAGTTVLSGIQYVVEWGIRKQHNRSGSRR